MLGLGFDRDTILKLVSVVLVILSSSLHEFGHAFAAWRCGDPTAKEQGRLTLNPLAHIDPFGSVILPFILVVMSGVYIAYAKPVPFNPYRLRNPKRDEAIIAVAGPLANIIQAVAGALVFHLLISLMYQGQIALWYYDTSSIGSWACDICYLYVLVNCSLAFFNLLPIPPLDGSKLLSPLFSGRARIAYERIQHYAMPLTLALIWFGPRILGFDPIGAWLDLTAFNLKNLLIFGVG